MKTKLIFAGLIIAAIAVIFITQQPKDTQDIQAPETIQFTEIIFELPSDWSINQNVAGAEGLQQAQFTIPDEQHNVQLNMDLNERFTPPGEGILTTQDNVTVYQVACGGAFACFGLTINDSYNRSIGFTIESDEQPPADLDGIWRPSTDLTRDQLIDFLLTATLTK